MREHKYQVYHKKLKRMYPVLSIDFEHSMLSCPCQDGCETGIDGFDFGEVELREFTGLQDKNGRDIYEGDVILWKAAMARGYTAKPETVKWHEAICGYTPFCIYDSDCDGIPDKEDHNGYEVIGNIYEHPELA